MLYLFIFITILHICKANEAIPYGLNIKHQTRHNKMPNSLGLMGKTQDYIDSLDSESVNYIKFMRYNKKRVKYNKGQYIGPNDVLYDDISMDKVNKLGVLEFVPDPPKRSVEVLQFDKDFISVEHGLYMFCGYKNNMAIPTPKHIGFDADMFRIESKENEDFFYKKTLVALTGVTHFGCTGPEVFIPTIYLSLEDARKHVEKLSKTHKYNNMDSQTAIRHMMLNKGV